jgi:hypothetical protein
MMKLKMWQMIVAIPGIIILSGIMTVGIGSSVFKNGFADGAREILSGNSFENGIVTEADLTGLPAPVQRYLRYTGIIGKEKPYTIRLKQTGAMKQTPEDQWKEIEAVEYYSVDPPKYVWLGQMAAGPFNIVAARDSYIDGRGRMFIKMLGVKTIGDVQGEEMDYSALVRFLNEMMWFPAAFVNDNIRWEAINDNSARVTIADGSKSASAVLYFDEKGALTNFVSDRYHEVNGVYVRDTWETPITGYSEFSGLKLPVKGEAVWKMSTGDFSYIKLEVTTLEYNTHEIFRCNT